jgi:hypothetical protein
VYDMVVVVVVVGGCVVFPDGQSAWTFGSLEPGMLGESTREGLGYGWGMGGVWVGYGWGMGGVGVCNGGCACEDG